VFGQYLTPDLQLTNFAVEIYKKTMSNDFGDQRYDEKGIDRG
jgi:hypothetical protein